MYDYAGLEKQLQSLISRQPALFSEGEVAEILHFIDVGEYGLALETLCDIILEEKKSIDAHTYHQIEELGRQMKMESPVWTRLKPGNLNNKL